MADLFTRLRMDTREFDDNIRQSRQQLEGMRNSASIGQQGLENLASSMKGLIAGYSAISIAQTAFQTGVKSSSESTRDFTIAVDTAKTSINLFFNSMKTGNWSNFKKGLADALKLSKDFATSLNNLKLGLPMTNAWKDVNDGIMDEFASDLDNPNAKPKDKYKVWTDKYLPTFNKQQADLEQIKKGIIDNVKKILAPTGIKYKDESYTNDLLFMASNPLHYENNQWYQKYKKYHEGHQAGKYQGATEYDYEYIKQHPQYDKDGNKIAAEDTKYIKAKQKAKAEYDAFMKTIERLHPDIIKAYTINTMLDAETIQTLNESLGDIAGIRSNMSSRKTEKESFEEHVKNGQWYEDIPKDKPKPSKPIAPEGSYQKAKENYDAALAEYLTAPNDALREVAKKNMEKYYKEMYDIRPTKSNGVKLSDNFARQSYDWYNSEISRIEKLRAGTNDLSEIKKYNDELLPLYQQRTKLAVLLQKPMTPNSLDDVRQQIRVIEEEMSSMDIALNPQRFKELQDDLEKLREQEQNIEIQINPEKFTNTKEAKLPKGAEDSVQTLNALASAMSSITQMTNDGAAAWLNWTANLLNAISAAIPAIAALTTAKEIESKANTKAAATGAAASQAGIPIVGPVLAVAAIATVLAALAAIPTFANGGIFESPLTTGDRNLARLNGGEMILNKGQQYNLFQMLDKGTPLGNSGNVTFKIQGKELVGVLNNYNNKIKRVM